MRTVTTKKLTNYILTSLILVISTPSVFAYPPDPDNAALLYYQTFILYEKPDDTMQDMVSDLSEGKIEPNPRITKYVESCRTAIELAVNTAEMPNCDWGLKYSGGLSMQVPHLAQGRNLARLIIADARILAVRGDYELAIDRCLSVRKIARHIGSEPLIMSYLVSLAIDNMTNECIQVLLADMPEDLATLSWLNNQLTEIDNRPSPLKTGIELERGVLGTYMTREKFNELLSNEELVAEASLLKTAQERFLAADEQFFVGNRAYWENHFAAVEAALDLSYAQAFAELKKVEEKVKKDVIENPDATGTAILATSFGKILSLEVKAKTFSNAVKTAVDICIIKAQTDRLPDMLPPDLPVDLFSGKPFEYEVKDDGFILRCQGKDLSKDEIYEYEFKLPM